MCELKHRSCSHQLSNQLLDPPLVSIMRGKIATMHGNGYLNVIILGVHTVTVPQRQLPCKIIAMLVSEQYRKILHECRIDFYESKTLVKTNLAQVHLPRIALKVVQSLLTITYTVLVMFQIMVELSCQQLRVVYIYQLTSL